MASNSERPLNAGDVIIDAKPIIHLVYNWLPAIKGKYCDNCLKYGQQLKKCSNCHQMSYCDKNCQRIDWKFHKNECKVLKNKRFKSNETKSVKWSERMLIRLWLTIKSDESFGSKRHLLFDGTDLSLNDFKAKHSLEFMEALPPILEDRDRMTDFLIICQHFKEYDIDFDRKELLQWFVVISSSIIQQEFMSYSGYTGGVPVDGINIAGIGLYLDLAAVSHSCLPNSVIVFNGLSMQMRAIEPISVGTQFTRSFVYLAQNKEDRHEFLKLKYLISDCDCLKCERNLDSDIDYQKLNLLFEKQTKKTLNFATVPFLNLSEFVSEMSVISSIASKALGKFNPKLTEILITEVIYRQLAGLCRRGVVGDEYYQRLEEHIRITYGVNHPIYIQTQRKDNPFFKLFLR